MSKDEKEEKTPYEKFVEDAGQDIHSKDEVLTPGSIKKRHLFAEDKEEEESGSVSPHHTSHENEGSDEINVAGLSGELADSQPPKAHKSSHESGGADAIKLDDLAEPEDNADLNVSTAKHGLCPKAPNDTTKFLRGDADWAVPPGGGAAGYGMTIVDEPFDSLNTGNIDGQGNYPHAGTWSVTPAIGTSCEVVVKSGSDKMLRLSDTSGTNKAKCTLDIDSPYEIIRGIFSVKVRVNNLNANTRGNVGFTNSENEDNWTGIILSGDGDKFRWRIGTGGANDFMTGLSANTWYHIVAYFDIFSQKVCIWVDDVWKGVYEFGADPDIFDRIIVQTGEAGQNDWDIEDLLIVNLHKK